jgi:hypothetical protein
LGDAALTRRAGKHSKLSAVVLKWSRARKRYERQGLLVEETVLQRAEDEIADKVDQVLERWREELKKSQPYGWLFAHFTSIDDYDI